MADLKYLGPTLGAKMMYLIRRKATTSREEMVAHWFANHMPQVISRQAANAAAGKTHAWRYMVSVFDAAPGDERPWDGVAQLWFDHALPEPAEPHGIKPADTFQQKVEPYVPWATTEYVVLDGSDVLGVTPNTLNAAFPCTRSGFLKMTFLVCARAGVDHGEFFAHWVGVHAANVAGVMKQVGGFRFVISHSLSPATERYAGMAELYFPDRQAWKRYRRIIQPDGMQRWMDPAEMVALSGTTEMIGIA